MKASGNSSVSEFVDRWRNGEPPCAQAVLRDNPNLAGNKSAVLGLAYEEFCLRREAGDPIAPSTFCNQFPTYSKSLERLLEVHELLAAGGGLADGADDSNWPENGDEFLGFELQEELGRGALGRVFLAGEPACGDRQVVLKIARHGGHEAKILGRLPHAHIVPILSVNEDAASGLTAVCMPFLGKATLCDVIDKALAQAGRVDARVIAEAAAGAGQSDAQRRGHDGPANSRRIQTSNGYINAVLRIGADLASALQFAHAQGILHRDIKASNVLLTSRGVPMLLDFNLSTDNETQDLRVGGTLPYAAPEQLRAILAARSPADGKIDARSDVFSLGVVLYELLCGALPFGSPSLAAETDERNSLSTMIESSSRAILARQSAGHVSLRQQNPGLDPAAARVIERCLEFKPEARPSSAAELAKSLRQCLTRRRRLARWSRLHRAVVASLSLLTVLLVTWGALALATRPPYATRMRTAGQQLLKEGKPADAVEAFNLALKAKPDDVPALLGRAAAFQAKGDYVSAARDYVSAADYSPAGVIRAAAAYSYAQSGSMRLAANWSRRALEAHEETPEVYNNYACSYSADGKLAIACEYLDEAIKRHPSIAAPYRNRARCELGLFFGLEQIPLNHALADIEQALKLEPNCPEILFDAASVYVAAGRAETAKTCFIAALKAGLPHEKVQNQPQFKKLLTLPDVKQLLGAPVPTRAAPPPKPLIPIVPLSV